MLVGMLRESGINGAFKKFGHKTEVGDRRYKLRSTGFRLLFFLLTAY